MGRKPCCPKEEVNRGAWTAEEDSILSAYVKIHGPGKWRSLSKKSGLKRCGKSCRLRWLNYLRPDIKRGNITDDEEDLIIRLHKLLGNRWSLIAGRLPGRTDNEIKNYWNTRLQKKLHAEQQTKTSEETLPVTEPANNAIETKAVSCVIGCNVECKAIEEAIAPESKEDDNWWEILTSMDGYKEISTLEYQDLDFMEDWSYNSMTNLLNCEDWFE